MARRLLICLAFATWCFADTWVEYAEGDVVYFTRLDPLRAVVLPVAALELLIAATLFAAWQIAVRKHLTKTRTSQYLFLFAFLAPLGIGAVAALRAVPVDMTPLLRAKWFLPAGLAICAVPVVWALLRPFRATRIACSALLYSWPILICMLVAAMRTSLLFPAAAFADGPLAAPLAASPAGPRVVWIIFDELSQTLAFANRPPDLAMPNLDRFRAESLYATHAEAPAGYTEASLPSLILGETVSGAQPAAPGDLRLRIPSRGGLVAWSGIPNIFDTARQLGFNTALVGWYHPYGRVLNRSLTECDWTAGSLAQGVEEPTAPQPLVAGMWDRLQLQLAALPLLAHWPAMHPGRYDARQKLMRFRFLNHRSIEIARDPRIGLALIHLPIPHPPSIYDRKAGDFTPEKRSYLDNLALVDRVFGTLRQALEESGLWERTAVLVTADHGWRTGLWRGSPVWTAEDERFSHQETMSVPFLLKFPGQASAATYNQPFNTLATRRLLTAILQGEVKDAAGAVALIESH